MYLEVYNRGGRETLPFDFYKMWLKGIAPPLAVESEGRSKPYKTEYLRCNFSVKEVEETDSFIVYNFPKLMTKYFISPFPSYAAVGSTAFTSLVRKD